MRLARKLGMITYRSARGMGQRFGRERARRQSPIDHPFGIDFEVESYLEAQAASSSAAFDPNCYLYLSRAMDLFDVADHGGSLAARNVAAATRARHGDRRRDGLPVSGDQQQELALETKAHVNDVDFTGCRRFRDTIRFWSTWIASARGRELLLNGGSRAADTSICALRRPIAAAAVP